MREFDGLSAVFALRNGFGGFTGPLRMLEIEMFLCERTFGTVECWFSISVAFTENQQACFLNHLFKAFLMAFLLLKKQMSVKQRHALYLYKHKYEGNSSKFFANLTDTKRYLPFLTEWQSH